MSIRIVPRTLVRRTTCLALVAGIFGSLLSPFGTAPARADANIKADYNFLELQKYDPLFREFAREAWRPPPTPAWAPRDLDQDPYFMRSQTFAAPIGDGAGERTAVEASGDEIRIQVAGTARALILARPLLPLFELDEYVFFKAKDDSLFRSRFDQGDPAYAEGVFFIDKQYLYAELARGADVDRRPVPVFFIPLAGRWTGRVEHVVTEPLGGLQLQNESGDLATIELDVLRRFAKGLHRQVQLASLMALKHDPEVTPGPGPWPVHLPPPASTAAFGTFLTGIDLEHPDRGVVEAPAGSSFDLSLIPKAHAWVLSPDLWDRLLRVAVITSGVWSLGTAAQFTVLKSRMRERRAYADAVEDSARGPREAAPDRTSRSHRLKMAARDNIDIFANGLAALATLPNTVVGYGVEYLADRSGFHFARNGWFRRVQESTTLFSRWQNADVNVNWKVYYLAVVILGTVDTAGVTLQLLFATPLVLPWVASFFGDHQRDRAIQQFSGHNANTNNLVTSEIMLNGSVHLVQGAYAYAAEQTNALAEVVRARVADEFRAAGRDLKIAINRTRYEAEVKRRVEVLLVQRHLPAKKMFVLSSVSLARALAATMGYRVDRKRLAESADHDGADPVFLLEYARHGVQLDALKKGRAELERRAAGRDIEDLRQAGVILAELQRRYRVLSALAKNPLRTDETLREAYQARKIMTLLSQDEVSVDGLRYLDLWEPADPVPLRTLIELKRAVTADFAREGRAYGRRELFHEVERRAAADSAEVELAFATYAGRGRTLEAQLRDIERDFKTGILGASVRNPRAARLAGQVFNEALRGLIDDRPETLRPSDEDIDRFGPRARTEARARVAARPRHLDFDELDVEVETLNVIKELGDDARARARDDSWLPPDQSDGTAARQAARAHRAALLEVQRRAARRGAGASVAITDEANQAVYREAYRHALAARVGLHPIAGARFDEERRDLERITSAVNAVSERWFGRVHPGPLARAEFISAEIDAGLAGTPSALDRWREYRRTGRDAFKRLDELKKDMGVDEESRRFADERVRQNLAANGGWRAYLEKLSAENKLRFLSHQYADAYLARYAELTVGSSDVVPQTSAAQPGLFQKARQLDVLTSGTPVARALTTVVRILESPFDAMSIRPGTTALLNRTVPFFQDVSSDTVQRAKLFLTYATITWPIQWYLWGVHFDAPAMLLMYGTGGLLGVTHYWVDRMLVNIGKPPMTDTWSKIKYSLLITTLTYPTYIPFFLMEEGWRDIYVNSIVAPIGRFLTAVRQQVADLVTATGHATADFGASTAGACQALLGSVF